MSRNFIHGTYTSYAHGRCRCQACIEAMRAYKSNFKARAKEGRLKIPHGTIGGYTNHGCRCDLCKKAYQHNQWLRRK
jgi:hypothetical protein